MRRLLTLFLSAVLGLTPSAHAGGRLTGTRAALTRPQVVVDAQTGFLLGGAAQGQWLSAPAAARTLRGGEPYWLYGLTRLLGTSVGRKPESAGVPCPDDAWTVDGLTKRPGAVLALSGGGDALPRVPQLLSPNVAVYQEAVHALLARHGLTHARPQITRILRCDLEGDGRDEVLISADTFGGLRPFTHARATIPWFSCARWSAGA